MTPLFRYTVTMKICTQCDVSKPLDDYYKDKRNLDGRMSWCRQCHGAKTLENARTRRGTKPSLPVETLPQGYRRCKRCEEVRSLEQFRKRPQCDEGRGWVCLICQPRTSSEGRYLTHVLRKYGLTNEQLATLMAQQAGKCAICDQPETALSRTGKVIGLSVDHCHTTGAVRGLLCRDCNTVLGKWNDNPDRFEAAAAYLRDRRGK